MQIVINIPDHLYKLLKDFPNDSNESTIENVLMKAVEHGTPLPKGHGAIKDVSQIEIPMCEDSSYEKWVQVAINSAPTIIEADKEQTE